MSESKNPLYLLPGFHGSAALFDPLVEHLSDEIVAHPMGFESADSLDDHLSKISPMLPSAGSFLLAESFSGLIALALMAAEPDRFKGAILSCSFARSPMQSLATIGKFLPSLAYRQTPLKRLILKYFCLNHTPDDALLQTVLDAVSNVPPEVIKRRIKVLAETDVRDRLSLINTPVLCLAASADRVVPHHRITELHALLPNAALTMLDGPHLLLQARPTEAAEVVSNFVNVYA